MSVVPTEFLRGLHKSFIEALDEEDETLDYFLTTQLKVAGAYWGLCGLILMKFDCPAEKIQATKEWVISCQDECGGIAPNTGHSPHISSSLYGLYILVLLGEDLRPQKEVNNNNDNASIDLESLAVWVASLQNKADGSFKGDIWGEVDTRYSYLGLLCLTLLDRLDLIDVYLAAQYVLRCQNTDGGFGPIPGAESHSAYTFCCVSTLALCMHLHHVDADALGFWLSRRQLTAGGFNGRPEKAPDVCYTWWILSTLASIDRLEWIDGSAVENFVIQCQDDEGGIADRPGNVADVFHTFFGIAGLSLLNRDKYNLCQIHPVYVLPYDTVKRLSLPDLFFQ